MALITEKSADILNSDSKATKIRYILADQPEDDSTGSGIPTMENTKAEIVAYLNEKEIEIPSEATNKQSLLDLIPAE